MPAHRILLKRDPFKPARSDGGFYQCNWSSRWIIHPACETPPFCAAYRCRFTLDRQLSFRIHVSADERYVLYLDGERIGRGPERGDRWNWFFESYQLTLDAGEHTLVAEVWAWGQFAPGGNLSIAPGFILACDDPRFQALVNTGSAPWTTMEVTGVKPVPLSLACSSGAGTEIDGPRYPWGVEAGEGEGWVTPKMLDRGWSVGCTGEWGEVAARHLLRTATLPPQLDAAYAGVVRVRHVAAAASSVTQPVAVRAMDDLEAEHAAWDLLLAGHSLTVPAHTRRRMILEIPAYLCAYVSITTSGGRNGLIRIAWTEALYCEAVCDTHSPKGNRGDIEGKYFRGESDVFRPEGGSHRCFEPLWWRSGRYVEILVETADQALIVERLEFVETRYPLEPQSSFACDDSRLGDLWPLCVRTLQICMHESWLDNAYYEQMMYVADTRLASLIGYTLTRDSRMAAKAIEMFHSTAMPSGIIQALAPGKGLKVIPPFALFWCDFLYDYALWRGDPDFIRRLVPAARTVLDAFWSERDVQGIIEYPTGWNFIDHTGDAAWRMGLPAGWRERTSADLNWQFVMTARHLSELEAWLGERECSARARRMAREVAAASMRAFWQEKRGLFSNDIAGRHFSEHPQCFALLSGMLDKRTTRRLSRTLADSPGLVKATLYFMHFLFDALGAVGRVERIFERLQEWYALPAQGFTTLRENPEPTRADCQAWGSHPLYHFFATIAGIRPASFGFGTVLIRPQFGHLRTLRASMVHPKGIIRLDARLDGDDALHATITLPPGVTGVLQYGKSTKKLRPGKQTVKLPGRSR